MTRLRLFLESDLYKNFLSQVYLVRNASNFMVKYFPLNSEVGHIFQQAFDENSIPSVTRARIKVVNVITLYLKNSLQQETEVNLTV